MAAGHRLGCVCGGGEVPSCHGLHIWESQRLEHSSSPMCLICLSKPTELLNVSHNPTVLFRVFTSLNLGLCFENSSLRLPGRVSWCLSPGGVPR